MTAAHSQDRCWCPACVAAAGLRLLARNRPDMAERVLADLPGRIAAALDEAYERGRVAGLKAAARAKPPRPAVPAGGSARPAFRRQAAELVGHVDRLGLTRTAALLGVTPGDMPALLAGTVEPPKSGMTKLRREVAGDDLSF